MISKDSTCWKSTKKHDKTIKKHCKFVVGEQMLKNHIKLWFGMVLGSVWEGSGTLQGVSWALLGASWPLFAPSKVNFFRALVQDVLQEASGIDLSSILGRFWTNVGRNLSDFEQIGGRFWTHLVKHSPPMANSLLGPPALTCSASRCAGVPSQRGWIGTLENLRECLESR